MNVASLFVAAVFLPFGLLNLVSPQNGVVRGFVPPSEWQADPRAAARTQDERARRVGVGFTVCGVALGVVGLLV